MSAVDAAQPGAARGWFALLLLAPFQFIFGLIYSWGAIAPAIHLQSGWSHATLNLAFSLTPLALLPSVVFAGRQLARISPKTLLAAALVLFTAGGVIAIAWDSPLPFMLGYSIIALGVGAGLSTAACIALVARLYPARRGSLGGGLLALYGMSSTVSAPVFDSLNAQLGWRPALAVLLLGYAALGWLAWFRLPATSPAATGKESAARITLWHMFRHARLRWALIGVLAAAPLGSASFAAIGQLSRDLGFSASFAVAAVSLMALGNGLGRLGFGILADALGARFSRNAVLAINAVAGLLLLTAWHGAGPQLFAVYPLLIGLSFGGMAGKLPALASHVVEQGHADSAFGLLFGTFALASFLGPLVGAVLGMHAALNILAVCAFGACLPALFGR